MIGVYRIPSLDAGKLLWQRHKQVARAPFRPVPLSRCHPRLQRKARGAPDPNCADEAPARALALITAPAVYM
eukprot:4064932-Pleurochrysis_carterae.AAC.1